MWSTGTTTAGGPTRSAGWYAAFPGPPDALADRVWVTVDEALVPDYAEDGSVWTNGKAGRVPDLADGDDPLGWEGFNAVPVDERHVPRRAEARHVGTTLLIGAGALGVLLAVAALTAPRDDPADTTAGGIAATTPSEPPLTNPTTVATSVAGPPSESVAVPRHRPRWTLSSMPSWCHRTALPRCRR